MPVFTQSICGRPPIYITRYTKKNGFSWASRDISGYSLARFYFMSQIGLTLNVYVSDSINTVSHDLPLANTHAHITRGQY